MPTTIPVSDTPFGPLVALATDYQGAIDDKESALYPLLTNAAKKSYWVPVRVENKFSAGTPDLFIFRGAEYFVLECKVCRRKKFSNILTDLHWQPGQLHFFQLSLQHALPYCLVVRHQQKLIFVMEERINALYDYPDIIRRW